MSSVAILLSGECRFPIQKFNFMTKHLWVSFRSCFLRMFHQLSWGIKIKEEELIGIRSSGHKSSLPPPSS